MSQDIRDRRLKLDGHAEFALPRLLWLRDGFWLISEGEFQ